MEQEFVIATGNVKLPGGLENFKEGTEWALFGKVSNGILDIQEVADITPNVTAESIKKIIMSSYGKMAIGLASVAIVGTATFYIGKFLINKKKKSETT